jgi:hypothetical protein
VSLLLAVVPLLSNIQAQLLARDDIMCGLVYKLLWKGQACFVLLFSTYNVIGRKTGYCQSLSRLLLLAGWMYSVSECRWI